MSCLAAGRAIRDPANSWPECKTPIIGAKAAAEAETSSHNGIRKSERRKKERKTKQVPLPRDFDMSEKDVWIWLDELAGRGKEEKRESLEHSAAQDKHMFRRQRKENELRHHCIMKVAVEGHLTGAAVSN